MNRLVRRAVLGQGMASMILAVLLIAVGSSVAISGLAGGLIATAANAIFSARVFGAYSAQEPGKLLARFYGAEFVKLVTVAVLFAIAFKYIESLNALALFGVFFVVYMLPALLVHRGAGQA